MIETIPPYAFVLVAAFLLLWLPRRLGYALGGLGLALAFGTVAVAPSGVIVGGSLFGFDTILFAVDGASRLVGLVFTFIGAMAVVYAWASDASTTMTAYALSYVGTSLGAVFVGDWLLLIFFWELMAVTSTLLVWEHGPSAVRAGFRYAVLHGVGGSALLAAVAWQYTTVGSFAYTAATGIEGTVPAILAAIGIGINVGFVGLHAWLPDTYPRPHIAASVFLSVYTTKTGVYAMYRAFPEGHLWIAYMGGAMAVFGAVFALFQSDMRRLLAYSIQSQVGYMIAGLGIGGILGTAGVFGHVLSHVLYKSLLFMAVGVVIYRTGRERLSDVGGLWRAMPITALAFTVGAASTAGVPGFNGFVTKGIVLKAAHHEHLDALWGLLLLGTFVTVLAFAKLGYFVFVAGTVDEPVQDANWGQSLPLLTVAGLCVFFGVVPDALLGLVPGGSEIEYVTFTTTHVAEGMGLVVLGTAGFYIAKRQIRRIGHVPDVDAIYNPLVFYGTRSLARAVTSSFAAIDRLVVRAARSVATIVRRPEQVSQRVSAVVTPMAEPPTTLRAGLGRSVLLLVGVLLSLIWVALLF